MSGLEKEELADRIKGMRDEEYQIAVKLIPDDILWDELQRRYTVQNEMIKTVKAAVKENSPADYQSKQDYK